MNRRVIFFALAAGVVLTAAALYFFYFTDERRVRARFEQLAEFSSKTREETLITAAQKIQGIAGLFDDRCEFRTHVPEITGTLTREDISGLLSRLRQYFSTIDVDFLDIVVSFPEENSASASLTSRVQAHGGRAGEDVDEIHELLCILEEKDGDWYFTDIEVVSVLER